MDAITKIRSTSAKMQLYNGILLYGFDKETNRISLFFKMAESLDLPSEFAIGSPDHKKFEIEKKNFKKTIQIEWFGSGNLNEIIT